MNRFFKSILIGTAIIASLSCTKEGKEFISVVPVESESADGIVAEAGLNSQTLYVESNSVWTLSIASEENSGKQWIVPGKNYGKGNAEVTLLFRENRYNERKATLTFTTKGGKKAVIKATQESANPNIIFKEEDIRVGSFNLRVSSEDVGKEHDWEKRKDKVIRSILNNDFDFFGVQEVCIDQQDYLQEKLGNIYEIKFFSPYAADGDGSGDKAQGLLYKKDVWELSEWTIFWPSFDNMLYTMHANDIVVPDKGKKQEYNRGSCCAILTHREKDFKVFIMVMHGFLDASAGDLFADVNNTMEQNKNPDGYPAFFVGDFNVKPDRPAYRTWAEYWEDTYTYLDSSKRTGPEMTFHGWTEGTGDDSRIDYIFFKGDAEPKKYVCDGKPGDLESPSDHYPVYADFAVKYTVAAE